MYRKILWFYIVILLDISLNSILTAHGKYHGKIDHNASLQEPLVDGIHMQEWEGGAVLWPRALHFGSAHVAAPRRRTVTLTNTANHTLHLFSISGKSPHFYASFFESKEVEPEMNTTFSVVVVALREGAVSEQLVLHTSRGALRYQVSAQALSSQWEVWPLALRVPHNATLAHQLTLRNPTPQPVQVLEVYSSAAWLQLELPSAAAAAPARAWCLPPHASAPIVRLRVALPPPQSPHLSHTDRTFVAFIRIRTNATGGAGGAGADGSLLVPVEAVAAPSGPYVLPPHVRLRARGSQDPPDTFQILVGNSGETESPGEAGVWGARCEPAEAGAPPASPAHANGASSKAAPPSEQAGVHAVSLRASIPPAADPMPAANLTLHYGEMWWWHVSGGGAGGAGGLLCGGWVRAGGALLPYSLTLYPGTLTLLPPELHFVTVRSAAADSAAWRVAEVRARNDLAAPLHLERLEPAPAALQHFHVEGFSAAVLWPRREAALARVRLRAHSLALRPPLTLDTLLTLHTNVSQYHIRLLVYEGTLRFEWEWPDWDGREVRLGAAGVWQAVGARGRVVNAGPAPLCLTHALARPPARRLRFLPCTHLRHPPPDHPCWCVAGGGWAGVEVVAAGGPRVGAARGQVRAGGRHHTAIVTVSLTALPGRLHVPHIALPHAAPYCWAEGAVVVASSLPLRMRLLNVTQTAPPPHVLQFLGGGEEVRAGVRGAGVLQHRPERACQPHCYTGMPPHTAGGAAWQANLTAGSAARLAEEAALAGERARMFSASPAERWEGLVVRTSGVAAARGGAWLRLHWPRVCRPPAAAAPAPVSGAWPLRVSCSNPSRSHALLLRPAIGPRLPLPDIAMTEAAACKRQRCEYAEAAFAVTGWRARQGEPRQWGGPLQPPALLLPPAASVDIHITFSPQEPAALTAYLYLRNNLTVMEGLQLSGRGVFPNFELGGRRPGALQRPLLLEASDCGAQGEGAAHMPLVARNTGSVPVRLRDWRVAGRPCAARGFALHPCAPLQLAPNETRTLTLHFSPDWTVARAAAVLELRSDLGAHRIPLRARAAAPLLPRCSARLPRPALESVARLGGAVLVVLVLVLVLVAAALDGERVLRRARAARQAGGVRAALDLRALAQPPAPPPAPPRAPPPPPPRRRRARRLDPLAESRAFERWRAALRRADDDDRSSEDADVSEERDSPPRALAPAPPAPPPVTRDSDDGLPDLAEDDVAPDDRGGDEDGEETGSASSTPPEPNDDDADSEEHASGGDDARRDSPVDRECDGGGGSPADDALRICEPVGEVQTKRPRRGDGDGPRRCEKKNVDGESAPRRGGSKPHGRKEKPTKRRGAAPPTPARGSPPAAPASPPPVTAVSGGVRLGASWSSVVARSGASPPPPQPLPPIGSDVRRRADPAPQLPRAPVTDDSLFYFNGALERTQTTPANPMVSASRTDSDFTWHPGGEYAAPARPLFSAEDTAAAGAFGGMGSVWGAWGWPPGPAALRPPPGFAAESPPRPVRPYDPFQSLASIWSQGALDWGRSDDAPDDP